MLLWEEREILKFRGRLTFEATLKEREHIEDMILSNFSDIDHINLEGVNHIVIDSLMT